MKKTKEERCPRCSRHCPRSALRCKCGRAYFAKIEAREAPRKESCCGKKYKWEKYSVSGGLAHKLFLASRIAKRGLRGGSFSEEQFFSVLSEQERTDLAEILEKLGGMECAACKGRKNN